jgi:NADPH:quinone reductase-like Zn-dependent oxidoreductase
VEAVGKNVAQFKPGDEVFGCCKGAFAEYACAPAAKLALRPENVPAEQAAAIPIAAVTALQALRDKGNVHASQKVLINGAAGGVGTFGVQIAKVFGASVTGVCSTRNVEMVRSIGAEKVIDYTQQDFTKEADRYDVIVDCVGNRSLSEFRRVLLPKGVYVGAGGSTDKWMLGPMGQAIKQLTLSMFGGQKFCGVLANINSADLVFVGDLVKARKVTPVIDRRYTLAEIREAIAYIEEGHARGKVIVSIG